MSPRDLEKLLGGYAAGTLTDAERQVLFAAAIEDQSLFDALACEQPLRDLLSDPAARARLLVALEPAPRRFWTWRPAAALLAMAAVGALAVVIAHRPRPIVTVARVEPAPAKPMADLVQPPAAMPATPAPKVAQHRPVKVRPAETRAELSPMASTIAKLPPPAVVPAAAAPPPPPRPMLSRTNLVAAEDQAPAPVARPFAAGGLRAPSLSARAIYSGTLARLALARTAAAGAQVSAQLALRYAILRRDASGEFTEVAPVDLVVGDTVELRLTANHDGYLSIAGAVPVALTANAPYTTQPLPTGPAAVKVTFTARPMVEAGATAPLIEVEGRETYVASPTPGGTLAFTVKLP